MSDLPISADYFLAKRRQLRKEVTDMGGRAYDALEIATKVLRLHYPIRDVAATQMFYNNEPVELFLRPDPTREAGTERPSHYNQVIAIDVYFMFDDINSPTMDEAFVVEVIYPTNTSHKRWNVATVKWFDLGWIKQRTPADNPIPTLGGQTLVNFWM